MTTYRTGVAPSNVGRAATGDGVTATRGRNKRKSLQQEKARLPSALLALGLLF